MSHAKITFKHAESFSVVKIEGSLKVSTLYCLSLLAQRYYEQGSNMILVDVTDTVQISDEVKELKLADLGAPAEGLRLVVLGLEKHTQELSKYLARYVN